MAPPKRKRPDRQYSQDDQRPSPHRPENLRMSQPQNSPRGGGGGGGYGGRGGGGAGAGGGDRRQSRNNGRVPQSPNVSSHASPTTMSPAANGFQSSRPTPSTPSAPAAAPQHNQPATPTSTVTPTRDVPESNEYLTPHRMANWNGEARTAVLQAALSAQRDGNVLTLSVIFHEIIEAAMDRQMGAGELGSIVRDIVAAPSGDDVDPVSTFLDTLSSLTQDRDKQALVQQMLIATDIDVSRMRTELESDLLGTLGLVRDSFSKMAVRKATHALYRQSNYNLLREETEGYSKLMTEYFTTVNSEPPTQDVVSETYQRVNALIGAFDLDIGRVLDVTLDVFANLLVKHGKFFVKFLRSSAWWPELRGLEGFEWEEPDVTTLPQWAHPDSPQWYYSDEERDKQLELREQRDRKFWQRVGQLGERNGIQAYFELGARRITANNRQPDQTMPPEGAPLSKQQAARKWADEWVEQTKTLPPPSNDVAAQLLGFKLRFYASDARDASDFLPDNLIHLAALLIKIGFISVLDLYPHLYPLEEDMQAHKERLLKAKKDKEEKERGTVRNALTMAGALPDDAPLGPPAVSRLRESAPKSESERSTPAKSDDATEKKSSLPEPVDQKYTLLKSLLCIGALPEALFILGRHPWLLDVYPDLHEFIVRIAHHSLSKVYEATRPIPADHIPVTPKGAGLRTASRPSDFIPRRTLRWAKPDLRDAGDGIDYRFYWEDWVDNVPVCQEVDDVIKFCTSFLGLLGPECGKDVVLLTKIVRIGKTSLVDDTSSANRKRWSDFCATFIAPALSFTSKNPGIINEVWGMFKHFDTATRYTIYQQWFSSTKPASLRAVFEQVKAATNYDLGRVAKKNTKEYGRKIAKLSYASPGIVFQLTLKRLINYPNMIDTLVECVKYLTVLGYDVLNWTLVTFFVSPTKGSTKDDGMLSAGWLKNIATFVGKAYQKHAFMDPTPVLQFIAHQLLQSEGELFMLDVLEQMVRFTGGITIYGTLSESMILSLCAGPMLRTWTLTYHHQDERHKHGSSARRFARYLKDTGLASQILVALAQHVDAYVYRDDQQDTPDKVLLFNLDKMRSILMQFMEFLHTFIAVDDFDELFPGPIELVSEYNVEPDIAFTIARTSIAAKANEYRTKERIASAPAETQSNGDVIMGGVDEKSATNSLGATPSGEVPALSEDSGTARPSADVEMKQSSESNEPMQGVSPSLDVQASHDPTNPAISALVEQIKAKLPSTFGEHPCLGFYVTFWQLSLPDVDTTGFKEQYESGIAHQQKKLIPQVPERRGYNSNISRKDTDEMREARIDIAKLKMEQQELMMTSNLTQTHLRAEMQRWFEGVPMIGAQSDALHSALLQDCFMPRSRMSLQDAQYAAAMLKFMHKSGTPGFRTIKLLDLLFNTNKLACFISMYSDDESLTFGRFINSILRELFEWHANKDDAYAKSAFGSDKKLPGFGRKFDADRNPTEHLSYDDFCALLLKWHKALFTALKGCLETGDFQQIRNSLVILLACQGSFPKVKPMALELKQIIESIAKNDDRQDIQLSAGSSLVVFRDFDKNFQSEQKFRNLPELPEATPTPTPTPVNGTSAAAPEQSSTPSSQETRLKPTAPAFKPRPETNGGQRTPADKPDGTPTSATQALPVKDREPTRPASKLHDSRAATPSQLDREAPRPSANTPVPPAASVPSRPDGRSTPQPTPAGRPSHTLPTRPDPQPLRSRQPERPGMDRTLDHVPHNRYDNRGPQNDYGRTERGGDPSRPREASPDRSRRPGQGGRTPDRMGLTPDQRDWPQRDAREYDDRAMRAPPRDARGPPVQPPPRWNPREARDPRDSRDQRERPESRGHPTPPLSMEPRRMASSSSLAHEHTSHRRDMPSTQPHQSAERNDHRAPRPASAATSPTIEGPTVNPARAALINQADDGRIEPPRSERDARRERGFRPQSPRRGDERRGEDRRGEERHMDDQQPFGYHVPREHRDERGSQPLHPGHRDRRDEPTAITPTGPRGGRNDPSQAAGASREMFQAPRSSRAQDPNYGRLNQPADPTPPSGPRSDRPLAQSQPPTPTPPSGPAASMPVGIHPSRLENIQRPPPGPSSQTGMANPPSGPRGGGGNGGGGSRAPQGPPQPPVNRGPPTGPASTDRGSRANERWNPIVGTINSVLTQGAPTPDSRPNDRSIPPQNPPVRGRGATRANGPMEPTDGTSSPMPPPQHASTPNARGEGQYPRGSRAENPPNRMEGAPQDDSRQESRGHRDSRRAERSGRDRSRSPDRSERRPEERSGRNGSARAEGEERAPDRERGSGREKRGSERDGSSRRDRDRESKHEPRESRDSSRRERGSRDDGRRDERRSRGGSTVDDRKRGRDPQDQGQGHGDVKRRR